MVNPQSMQLNEKIDFILQGSDLVEQATRAQAIARSDATFVPLMHMASLRAQKIIGLPEGMPSTYKPETSIPNGIADTTVRQEFRRIKNFLPGGSTESLPRTHRESVWTTLLQGLHWKEADVIINIKDQTLFTKYPQLRNVLVELSVKVDVPATLVKDMDAPGPDLKHSEKPAKKEKKAKAPKPE